MYISIVRGLHLSVIFDTVFNFIRRRLRSWPMIASSIRAMRAIIHFGPWRIIPITTIRYFRKTAGTRDADESLIADMDGEAIANELRTNSVATAGVLPDDICRRLQDVSCELPPDHYQLAHLVNDDIRRITEDPGVLRVLRAYLGCEPELLESTLSVTGTRSSKRRSDQTYFHFDFAGWESLNVMIYISDVTDETSPHIVARGSHDEIGLYDAIRGTIPDEEAIARFGNKLEIITGAAGTLFFENTEAFHRRKPSTNRRVMLNLLYASHRSCLSHGRTSRTHKIFRERSLAS